MNRILFGDPVFQCDVITERKQKTGYTKARKQNKEACIMAAININDNNFQNEVMNSDKKVLLDFWAPWCGPCRMVVPLVEEIARERSDIKVGKVNVDENPELARQFGIMSIPTLVVMEEGRIVNQAKGARNKKGILALL
jgi:thioredoxin 1